MTVDGRPRCNGGRTGAFCSRSATAEVFYLGQWRPYCRYHVGSYYDLPHRKLPGPTIEAPPKRLIRKTDAAAYLGIHPHTLERLDDVVPHYRLGGRSAKGDRYYSVDDLDRYLASRRVERPSA